MYPPYSDVTQTFQAAVEALDQMPTGEEQESEKKAPVPEPEPPALMRALLQNPALAARLKDRNKRQILSAPAPPTTLVPSAPPPRRLCARLSESTLARKKKPPKKDQEAEEMEHATKTHRPEAAEAKKRFLVGKI